MVNSQHVGSGTRPFGSTSAALCTGSRRAAAPAAGLVVARQCHNGSRARETVEPRETMALGHSHCALRNKSMPLDALSDSNLLEKPAAKPRLFSFSSEKILSRPEPAREESEDAVLLSKYRSKVQVLEKCIDHLQSDHANSLRGLHAEIERLSSMVSGTSSAAYDRNDVCDGDPRYVGSSGLLSLSRQN